MSIAAKAIPALKEYMAPKKERTPAKQIQGSTYQYCTGSTQTLQLCAQFYLSFDIGWTSNQLTDQYRIYNLTLSPFAYIGLNANFSITSGALGLSMSPYLSLVDWEMPLSFELVTTNMFCVNAF